MLIIFPQKKLILLGKGSKVFNFNSISLEKYVPVTDEIDIYH